jgi:glycosyltransferase involved in cell wall biosynthesis
MVRNEMPRILLLDAQANTMFIFRGEFIQALVKDGYSVTAATADLNPDVVKRLSDSGVSVRCIAFKRAGMNPFMDILSLYKMYVFIKKLQPDIFLGVTIKPSTLGVIAARLAGVPRRFALVTGLGYAFTDGSELKRGLARIAARWMYKIGLRFAHAAIFQNEDDRALFVKTGLIQEGQAARVNGSGVNLEQFAPPPMPPRPFTFLMISRLLKDKGVREYVGAARIIKRLHPQTRFMLVGARDQNPTSIAQDELQNWIDEGVVEYGGSVADVRPAIAACHVFVLPSYYREGIPKTLMEALAMGRPIITTPTPGCRETVKCGLNGLLVPVRDVDALAVAELELLKSSEQTLMCYGAESRSLAEEKFDVNIVIDQLRAVLNLP